MRSLNLVFLSPILFVLAACGPGDTIRNAIHGEPIVDDSVWFLSPGGPDQNGYQYVNSNASNYLPYECIEPTGELFPPSSRENQQINQCIYALRNVIDRRYEHFIDGLNGSISAWNGATDTAIIGASAAASVVGGPVAQLLSVATTALAGTQKAVQTDLLYNHTVPVLISQMEKDRSCWGTIIENQLKTNGYTALKQGFNDLIAYSRAGSFTNAMRELQANTGAQATKNKTMLQATKSSPTKSTGAPSGKSTKKPASGTSGTDDKSNADASDSTTAAMNAPSNELQTCGAQSPSSSTTTVTATTQTSPTQTTTRTTTTQTATSSEASPVTVPTVNRKSKPVVMQFTSSEDPIEAIIAANTHEQAVVLQMTSSLNQLLVQSGTMKSADGKSDWQNLINSALTKLKAADTKYQDAISKVEKEDNPAGVSMAYYEAELNLQAGTSGQQAALQRKLADAQLNNAAISAKVKDDQAAFDSASKSTNKTIMAVSQIFSASGAPKPLPASTSEADQ